MLVARDPGLELMLDVVDDVVDVAVQLVNVLLETVKLLLLTVVLPMTVFNELIFPL